MLWIKKGEHGSPGISIHVLVLNVECLPVLWLVEKDRVAVKPHVKPPKQTHQCQTREVESMGSLSQITGNRILLQIALRQLLQFCRT